MTKTIPTTRSRIGAAVVLAGIATSAFGLATSSAAGATMGCGQTSFGFEGTRLLNDGISNSAGPFSITLPAGTYDVVMQSYDAHDEHPGQVDQTAEQWYAALDSGWVSPVSSDVPDDSNTSVDVFEGLVVPESSAITLHHLGEGNVNSVSPICIGFTPVAAIEPPAAVVEPPAVEVAPPVAEPALPVEMPVNEPEIQIAGPKLPAKDVVELPEEPAVVVEVAAEVEELAYTGLGDLTAVLAIIGTGMVILGGGLTMSDRLRLR
jgi:hypothetical protein